MPMAGQPSPSRRDHLDDEAALDRLSETALAETELATEPAPQTPDDDPLGAEMFLDIAAGFLGRRADRGELIERLRARVLPQEPGPPTGAPAAVEPAPESPSEGNAEPATTLSPRATVERD